VSSILIIGAGWLGRPLAKQLSTEGNKVVVTNRSLHGVEQSQLYGLDARSISLPLESTAPLSTLILRHNIKTVIGCITPGFRKSDNPDWNTYANNWLQIAKAATQGGVDKVIMISSTAVYPSLAKDMIEEDANFGLAQSSSDFDKKSLALLNAEQKLISSQLKYVIIRCSGLVDDVRHPSRFVPHLKSISRLAPANMLHKTDAIGIVQFAVESLTNQVINASTPHTVNKAEFYQAALLARNIDAPLPDITDIPDKRINSQKSQLLGYRYRYQNTLDFL
jgi:nucleoside-diphosphate-sugar epimerase